MIHERNNSITLDQQIAQIRADINDGKQSFPIDIVDTIGNDSQLYYERADGYQEKYVYDGDGSITGYWDSTMEVKQVGDLNFIEDLKHYFEVTPREQVLKDWDESAPLAILDCSVGMGDGGLNQRVEDISQRLDKALEYQEPMVYLVEMSDVKEEDNVDYDECANTLFKAEAIRQSKVMSIKKFESLINKSSLPMLNKYIRFL